MGPALDFLPIVRFPVHLDSPAKSDTYLSPRRTQGATQAHREWMNCVYVCKEKAT